MQVDSGWLVVTVFLHFSLARLLNHAHLGMVRKISSLCSKLLVKLMKSQVVEGTYILTSGYGWFRCEWVKISGNRTISFAVTKREIYSGCGKNA